MFTKTKQEGVALITALMIVAIASIISANISTKLQLDIRRTGNIIASDQAKLYTLAAEELAQRYLLDDLKNNQIDDLSEAWAQPYIFPLDDGTLTATLTDLQSCINLNSLVNKNAINLVTRTRLEQLFTNLSISPQLTQPIIDWIDADVDTTIPDGAEDGYYTGLESPYRSANSNLQSISELGLIKGFEDQKIIAAIGENVCAFKNNSVITPINVNTAPLEVLLSLSSNMTEQIAKDIDEHRSQTPFTNINDFRSFGNLATIIPQSNELSVNTNYFMLETNVKIGSHRIKMFSIIHRDASTLTSIISRSQGVY